MSKENENNIEQLEILEREKTRRFQIITVSFLIIVILCIVTLSEEIILTTLAILSLGLGGSTKWLSDFIQKK